jgi:sialic acid synthase
MTGSGEEIVQAPIIVCEIGCNHKGDMGIARKMIDIAADFCGVDIVKFQKRTNRELLSPDEYKAPHPEPSNAYADSYGDHREFLEFDMDQHRELKDYCDEKGVVYSTSVWDMTSAREISGLEPDLIKIPSATNTNLPVLDWLFENYGGELHVSLGMTNRKEEDDFLALADRHGRMKDLVLYHCVSGYPVETGDLCLGEIERLIEDHAGRVGAIGFSGHHKGIAADIAALALGATHFERHFTLDRTWKGTDHAASLEPDGMRRLTRDLKSVATSLNRKGSEILPVEEVQRAKLKRHTPAA